MVMIDGKEICLDSLKPYEGDGTISVIHEVLLPNEYGGNYVITKRYKTPNEIYRELHKALDLSVCKCGHEWKPKKWDSPCPKCNDDDDRYQLVDEYDSCCQFGGDEDREIAKRGDHMSSIAVYSEPGGSEGYTVYVSIIFQRTRESDARVVNVYRIKSFRGFEHCHDLVKRIMKLMGIWH